MTTSKINSKAYFKTLQLLYFSILGAFFGFLIISFFLVHNNLISLETEPFTDYVIIVAAAFLTTFGAAFSNFYYQKKLKKAHKLPALTQKTSFYQKILIMRYVILEGVGFLTLLAYIISESYLPLACAALLFLFMTSVKPTKEKLVKDLQLNDSDASLVYKEDAIISEINT